MLPPGSDAPVLPTFDRLVAEYGGLIARISQSYEADAALREDLRQQILLAIWQSLPNFRGEASLKTFVARIAQNRAISFVAKQVRQPKGSTLPEDLEAADPNPEQAAIAANRREMLVAATRRLPLPQREIIVLILEGFSYGEIGEMLDINPNALALRLSRAKAALTKMLEPAR